MAETDKDRKAKDDKDKKSAIRPHYTLEELLTASDYSRPRSLEEQEWFDAPATGKELI